MDYRRVTQVTLEVYAHSKSKKLLATIQRQKDGSHFIYLTDEKRGLHKPTQKEAREYLEEHFLGATAV